MERRQLISWTAGLSLAVAGLPVRAQRSPALRMGVAPLIQDSGLAGRWKALMARDLGLKVNWVRAPSSQILADLESGALPIGLFLRQALADNLERDGLIHDRRTLARTQALLLGPASDPAQVGQLGSAPQAMRQILQAQAAGLCRWEAPAAQSALRPLADALLTPGGTPAIQGRALTPPPSPEPGYRLILKSEWAALPRAARVGLKVFLDDAPALELQCQVARSFRAHHPAGKLLGDWLDGPVGRRGVQQTRAMWRPA